MKNKFLSLISLCIISVIISSSCSINNNNENDDNTREENADVNLKINVGTLNNGYVIPSAASAKKGEEVSFKIIPNEGYYLTSFSLNKNLTTISYDDNNLVFDNLSKTYIYNTTMKEEINITASFDNKAIEKNLYDQENDILYTSFKIDPYGNEIERIASMSATDYLKKALNDGELGYIILKGQENHNDADQRTNGVIEAMNEIAKEGNFKSTLLDTYLCVDENNIPWNEKIATQLTSKAILQYKDKLDLIIANSDYLAIAASEAENLNPNIPILGYEGGKIDELLNGKFDGTVAFPYEDQALLTAVLLSNLTLNKDPVIDVFYGGKVSLDFTYFDENLILSDYAPVLRKNIKDFQNNAKRNVAPNEEIKGKKLLLTCYSKTDNTATRLFESILYYTKVIGFDVDTIVGDGNNNDKFIQDIKNMTNEKHYDAIALNPLYVDTLNDYLNVLSKETPIVVYNRVPSNFLSLNQDNVYGVNVSFDIAKNAGNIVKKWYNYSLGLD